MYFTVPPLSDWEWKIVPVRWSRRQVIIVACSHTPHTAVSLIVACSVTPHTAVSLHIFQCYHSIIHILPPLGGFSISFVGKLRRLLRLLTNLLIQLVLQSSPQLNYFPWPILVYSPDFRLPLFFWRWKINKAKFHKEVEVRLGRAVVIVAAPAPVRPLIL